MTRTVPSHAAAEVLAALLGSFAICAQFVPVASPDHSFVELLYLANPGNLLFEGILFAALLFLGLHFDIVTRNRSLCCSFRVTGVILAVVFAGAVTVGRAFNIEVIGLGVYGTFSTMTATWGRVAFSLIVFIGLALVFYYLVCYLLSYMEHIRKTGHALPISATPVSSAGQVETRRKDSRLDHWLASHEPWGYMLVLVICWLPHIIIFFPGCVYHDGAIQIRQILGIDPLSAAHPLFSTFLIGTCLTGGKALGSDTLGIFFYTLLQTAVLSYACSKIIQYSKRYGNGRLAMCLALLFFAFVPIWPDTVVSVKKDGLSYAFFILFTIAFIDCMSRLTQGNQHSKSSSNWRGAHFAIKVKCEHPYLRLFAFAMLVSLQRSEGIYLVIAGMIGLIIYALANHCGASIWRVAIAAASVVLGYYVGYRGIAIPAFNAETVPLGQSLTIPIQQVARTWILNPDSISSEDYSVFDNVIDLDSIDISVYTPKDSDNIKFAHFNNNCTTDDLVAFGKAYLDTGFKSPGTYASAFVDQTVGWWDPELAGDPGHGVSGMGISQLNPKWELYADVISVVMPFGGNPPTIAPGKSVMGNFVSFIDMFAYIPAIGMLVYPPIYFWALLLLFAYAIACRRPEQVVLQIPSLLIIAVCIVSPINGLTRYAMSVMAVIPLLLTFATYEKVQITAQPEAPRHALHADETLNVHPRRTSNASQPKAGKAR